VRVTHDLVYQYLNHLNRLHDLVFVSSCRDVEVVSVDPNLLPAREMKQLELLLIEYVSQGSN